VSDALAEDDVAIEVEGAQGASVIGRVAAVGARAAGLLDRRVLAGPIDPCGECEICRRGGAAVCPRARRRDAAEAAGGRIVAGARWLVPLGDGLELPSPAGAAAAGDVAVAYTLYARTGIGPREPTVIVGASPIARFLVEILRAKSASPVVVADPAETAWIAWLAARGAAIARAGASATDDEIRAAVAAELAVHGAGARPWRVLAASPAAALRAAALAGPRSTLTLLAPVPELPGDVVAREVTVIGVAGAHPDLVVEAAAMCAKGEIDLQDGTAEQPNDVMRAIVGARSTPL
jgi:6-hydroxycyclohex-1-ene-1-carbonyl-CoA dehydrogenase